jgi:hypothetical protein
MNIAICSKSRHAAKARSVRPITRIGVVGETSGTAANEPMRRAGGNFVVAEAANGREAISMDVPPMLLIHNERMETFRLLAQWVRHGFRALTGQLPAGTAA